MLFILAMEPLQRMFQLASVSGVLSQIHNRVATLRASLYADDAAVFIKPTVEDVYTAARILADFGHASGLITNRSKCEVYPIQCEGINIEEIMAPFSCPVQSFPCKYLGLPLHFKKLKRVDVQPLIDKVANRLPSWKGKFLNRAGRLKLVNAVLSAVPTYFLTMFSPKKWLIKHLDKIRRGFFGREMKWQVGVIV
jgi:hypothetical protein